jgi:chromosome segregation ATPase
MSIYGKALAIVNVVLGIVFLVLAVGAYGTRTSWQYQVQQAQLLIDGMPVEENQTNAEGYRLVDLMGKSLAGEPATTQKDAAKKRHDELLNRIESAQNKEQALAEVLLPLARGASEREEIRRQIKAGGVNLQAPDGPFEKYFQPALTGRTAGGQQLDYNDWSLAIAHVLFNTDTDPTQRQHTALVVGLNHYVAAADTQAANLSAMVPVLQKLMADDQAAFEVEYRGVMRQVIMLHERIQSLDNSLAKQQQLRSEHQGLVKARETNIAELEREIQDTRQRQQAALKEQGQLEAQVFAADRAVAQGKAENVRLVQQIRDQEQSKTEGK